MSNTPPTSDIIHDFSDLPENLDDYFYVSAPRDNRSGKGKSANIGIGAPERVRYVQTPRVFCPFGVEKAKQAESTYETIKMLITIRSEAKGAVDFLRLCEAADKAVINAAFKNQTEWFGTPEKDYKSLEIIADRYFPLVKQRAPYDPQITAKIDEASTRVFSKGTAGGAPERIEDVLSVQAKTTMRVILRFGPAWAAGGRFGLQVRADQILVVAEGGMSLKRDIFEKLQVVDDEDDTENKPPGDEN